jgi:hypothetical protein
MAYAALAISVFALAFTAASFGGSTHGADR